ncbi:MAG: DUF5011 domain-containing protein, partial [Bacteroidota bacterium]|nr:DUF5011 domain-containing protein [Bacteroidota bacterium]
KAQFSSDTIAYVNGYAIFTNKTVLGTGNTYTWDFESNGSIDDTDPLEAENIYTATGDYYVTLRAVNCKGRDSITKKITVIAPTAAPTADFKVTDTVDMWEQVTFFDRSTQGPYGWQWEISPGDFFFTAGTTPSSRNPVVVFYEPGYYTVSLTASNDFGPGQRITRSAVIFVRDRKDMCEASPEITFVTGKFYDSGGDTDPYGNNETCKMTFPYCGKSMVMNFKSFNFAPGDYLRAYDGVDNTGRALHTGLGFTNGSIPGKLVSNSGTLYFEVQTNTNGVAEGFEAEWEVIPYDKPEAVIVGADTLYRGILTSFYSDSKGRIDSMYWDFDSDDIWEDSAEDVTYAYTAFGLYTIRLIVYSCGGTDTAYKQVIVVPITNDPTAEFTASMTNVATTDFVRFTDLSTEGPSNREWTFIPDSVVFIKGSRYYAHPLVQFPYPGKYDVKLWVRNIYNDDTIRKYEYINVFEYCVPNPSATTVNYGIKRFALNTIDYASGVGGAVYTDYTKEQATALEIGGTYNVTVENPSVSANIIRKVWIDFNQDGDFDDVGELAASNTTSSAQVWTGSFKVSIDALLGPTRVRVMSGYLSTTADPCGGISIAEYEDYRIVITPDKEPPLITLRGSNPTYSEIGYQYIDSGAFALDAVDGDLTSLIIVSHNVDSSTEGTYYVRYNVTDSSGNIAAEVVRTVIVTPDKTPPVVTLLGDNPMKVHVYTSY